MITFPTDTVRITIEAPFDAVVADLAEPVTHPEWATEFFGGPARPGSVTGEFVVPVPMMGGETRMRIEHHAPSGAIDMFLAPGDAPFGPPLPIRVLRNGDGADVLFTLTRFPGMPDEAWIAGLTSMRKELDQLKRRLESATAS